MAGTCPDCGEWYEGCLGAHFYMICKKHKHRIQDVGHGKGKCMCGATFVKIKSDAELEEEWDRLNLTEVFGMTFEEFSKMTADAIDTLMKENPDFRKFVLGE